LLGVHERGARNALFFGVEEHVDVLPGENLPVEPAVLNLVLSEAADLRLRARDDEGNQRERSRKRAPSNR
jgi:hypothetical protein